MDFFGNIKNRVANFFTSTVEEDNNSSQENSCENVDVDNVDNESIDNIIQTSFDKLKRDLESITTAGKAWEEGSEPCYDDNQGFSSLTFLESGKRRFKRIPSLINDVVPAMKKLKEDLDKVFKSDLESKNKELKDLVKNAQQSLAIIKKVYNVEAFDLVYSSFSEIDTSQVVPNDKPEINEKIITTSVGSSQQNNNSNIECQKTRGQNSSITITEPNLNEEPNQKKRITTNKDKTIQNKNEEKIRDIFSKFGEICKSPIVDQSLQVKLNNFIPTGEEQILELSELKANLVKYDNLTVNYFKLFSNNTNLDESTMGDWIKGFASLIDDFEGHLYQTIRNFCWNKMTDKQKSYCVPAILGKLKNLETTVEEIKDNDLNSIKDLLNYYKECLNTYITTPQKNNETSGKLTLVIPNEPPKKNTQNNITQGKKTQTITINPSGINRNLPSGILPDTKPQSIPEKNISSVFPILKGFCIKPLLDPELTLFLTRYDSQYQAQKIIKALFMACFDKCNTLMRSVNQKNEMNKRQQLEWIIQFATAIGEKELFNSLRNLCLNTMSEEQKHRQAPDILSKLITIDISQEEIDVGHLEEINTLLEYYRTCLQNYVTKSNNIENSSDTKKTNNNTLGSNPGKITVMNKLKPKIDPAPSIDIATISEEGLTPEQWVLNAIKFVSQEFSKAPFVEAKLVEFLKKLALVASEANELVNTLESYHKEMGNIAELSNNEIILQFVDGIQTIEKKTLEFFSEFKIKIDDLYSINIPIIGSTFILITNHLRLNYTTNTLDTNKRILVDSIRYLDSVKKILTIFLEKKYTEYLSQLYNESIQKIENIELDDSVELSKLHEIIEDKDFYVIPVANALFDKFAVVISYQDPEKPECTTATVLKLIEKYENNTDVQIVKGVLDLCKDLIIKRKEYFKENDTFYIRNFFEKAKLINNKDINDKVDEYSKMLDQSV